MDKITKAEVGNVGEVVVEVHVQGIILISVFSKIINEIVDFIKRSKVRVVVPDLVVNRVVFDFIVKVNDSKVVNDGQQKLVVYQVYHLQDLLVVDSD